MSIASHEPRVWRRAASVLAAAASLGPASALACGFCNDAAMRRQHWETSLAMALVVGLGVEAIAYVLYRVVLRRETSYPRAPVLLMAGFATIVVLIATEANGTFMAATFAVGLAVTLVRSLIEDAEFGLLVVAWRILLVVLVAAAMVVRSHPTQVKTTALVRLAVIAPDSWGEAPSGWVEEQLQARPDAKAEVEKRLAQLEGQNLPGPRTQDVELFRLHRLLGGEPARYAGLCRKWGVTASSEPTIESWHERPRPPDGLLSRLCGAAHAER